MLDGVHNSSPDCQAIQGSDIYAFYSPSNKELFFFVLILADFWIMNRSECSEDEWNATYMPDVVHSTWGFARGKLLVTPTVGIGATTVLMSLAVRSRKRAERNMNDWPILDVRPEVFRQNRGRSSEYSPFAWPYYFVCQLWQHIIHGKPLYVDIRFHEENETYKSEGTRTTKK